MGVPVREFVLGVLELFGVERAMFASNYPVDSLCASFDTIYRAWREFTAHLPERDQCALLADTARRIYRIPA